MMRKYQTQYIKENGFDDYVMEQAMLTSGHPGASKMIPGYLPPPPMPPLPGDDMDADIGYKSLPPLPAINGKVEYGGIAGKNEHGHCHGRHSVCSLTGRHNASC